MASSLMAETDCIRFDLLLSHCITLQVVDSKDNNSTFPCSFSTNIIIFTNQYVFQKRLVNCH